MGNSRDMIMVRGKKFIILLVAVCVLSFSLLTSAATTDDSKANGAGASLNTNMSANEVKNFNGAPVIKLSALGFFAADIWKGLPINNDNGTSVSTGVFGMSASFDYFPCRAYWHIGVEYNWITTVYASNLHTILGELGYSFRPARDFYITPSISGGIIMGSRSFSKDVPNIGWQMGLSLAFSYRIYDGICIDLEPNVLFGSDKHNAFSFIPLTVGISYFY